MTVDKDPFTVKRDDSNNGYRNGPPVTAGVIAWNDTHVLIDVYVDGKLTRANDRRRIDRFMADFGL